MSLADNGKFQNVCPVNCPSSCTIISSVVNSQLVHIDGDPAHPYTEGKLCSKGLSFVEKNYHPDRLKYPYYQDVKGSGNFRQISWEKAFELILNNIINVYKNYKSFLPLALYKGSGNIGVHHSVTNNFFNSFDGTTKIVESKYPYSDIQDVPFGTGHFQQSDPSSIKDSSIIIVWGANPAATNIHLIPDILFAKSKGAKLVVIDPIYTQTAELADLYIQIKPGTDGALANTLLKKLIENDLINKDFIDAHTYGFETFEKSIENINIYEYLSICDVNKEAINILLRWFKLANDTSYFIGSGIRKHANGEQTMRCIESIAAARGDIGKKGGGIFLFENTNQIFNNQQYEDPKSRIVPMDLLQQKKLMPPIDLLWISCGNPLNQNSELTLVKRILQDIPFVVTTDHFLTPTAEMSNLVLPTTTPFEEMDIIINSWHKEVLLNEQAIPPYFECRSEWSIVNELAKRVSEFEKGLCSFPICSSEEEYLNEQFNDRVYDLYNIRSVFDMRNKPIEKNFTEVAWKNLKFATETKKFHFYSNQSLDNKVPLFREGKAPSEEFPFWLITSHHPYMFNSQFHYLHLMGEEPYLEINSKVAKELGFYNGEIIKVFNSQGTIEIKAVYSSNVPKDVLRVYTGLYPGLNKKINSLVSALNVNQSSKVVAFYDTFVNISKW